MKKMRVVTVVFALFLMFGFYGAAFGGGPENPSCSIDPYPDASQCDKTKVYAEITIAREAPCIVGNSAYSVHIVIRDKKNGKPKKVHLFSFSSPLEAGDLCALEEDFLIEEFFRIFCDLGVQEAFGFDGIAVIKELEIVREENCGPGNPAEMIQLEVVICDAPLD